MNGGSKTGVLKSRMSKELGQGGTPRYRGCHQNSAALRDQSDLGCLGEGQIKDGACLPWEPLAYLEVTSLTSSISQNLCAKTKRKAKEPLKSLNRCQKIQLTKPKHLLIREASGFHSAPTYSSAYFPNKLGILVT